jgi:hypothetical protein
MVEKYIINEKIYGEIKKRGLTPYFISFNNSSID